MFKMLVVRRNTSFSEIRRFEIFLRFAQGKLEKKEGPLFTFLRWFYGKDFEWQYLSLEDAKPYLEFFKDKKTLDWFVFCPKQDNEWDHLYDTYLKRLQSYTNLLFKKDIIALLGLEEPSPRTLQRAGRASSQCLPISIGIDQVILKTYCFSFFQIREAILYLIKQVELYVYEKKRSHVLKDYMRKCKFCGAYFFTTRKDKIYCSDRCSYGAQDKKRRQKEERKQYKRTYMRGYMRDYRRRFYKA